MATPRNNSRQLITKAEMDNPYPFRIADDVLQLQADTLNVEEGRIDINTFPSEYQDKIRNSYRFSATKHMSNDETIAKMTPDTLDLI